MIPQNTGGFQYISCFYRCFWKYISIHLMFLLIQHVLLAKRKLWLISIHPMFLLISAFCPPLQLRLSLGGLALHRNFNTSHVSINPFDEDRIAQKKAHFNTSHVSINRGRCWCSPKKIGISIHLMFLLISMSVCTPSSAKISIHLMFLLIASYDPVLRYNKNISIHLMFLLICKEDWDMAKKPRFQYISCFY